MADRFIVTEEVLKQASGEFCLESIFVLNFSGKGILSLGSISKCLNLCMLDLSSNHLSAVGELAVLTTLEHLDLSNNNLSNLDGLNKLDNLSRLNLAGNKISCFDTLLPLSALCKLKHLTLQQSYTPSSNDHSSVCLINPVCQEPTYNTVMSELFPALQWLDGEVVKEGTIGKQFYDECREINRRSREWRSEEQDIREPKLVIPLSDPLSVFSNEQFDGKITSLLAECKETSIRVQKHLKNVRNELKGESSKHHES